MKKPFVHLLKTPNAHYVFDVNTDRIVPISKDTFEYLSGSAEIRQSAENELLQLTQSGLLSDHHVTKVEHYQTHILNELLDSHMEYLILQVTQACNLTCSYCPYAYQSDSKHQRSHSPKRMSWNLAKKSIDFFAEHSTDSEEVGFSFYGGEPLLMFPLVKKAILYIEDQFEGRNISFGMTTNGTLLNDEIVEFLVAHKVRTTFSIDGPSVIHDKNRKKADGSGSYNQAIGNLEKLLRAYGDELSKHVGINMVLNPADSIDDVLKLFDERVFSDYDVNVGAGHADDDFMDNKLVMSDEHLSQMRYQYFLGFLSYLKEIDGLNIPPIIRGYFATIEKDYENLRSGTALMPDVCAPSGPCIPGQRRLFVNADGIFYPCEKVNELSTAIRIGDIDHGINYKNAKAILNIGALTEEKCKNCFAFKSSPKSGVNCLQANYTTFWT